MQPNQRNYTLGNIPVDAIYTYGFTLTYDELNTPSTIEAMQPFIDNQVEMALTSDGSLIFKEEEFNEIKEIIDTENRKINLADLRDYPSFHEAIYFYVVEDFPLLRMDSIMGSETEGEMVAALTLKKTVGETVAS